MRLAVFSWYNNVRRQPYRADNGRCSFRFASKIRSYCKMPKNARHNLCVLACCTGGSLRARRRGSRRGCCASQIYSLIVRVKRARDAPKRTLRESTKKFEGRYSCNELNLQRRKSPTCQLVKRFNRQALFRDSVNFRMILMSREKALWIRGLSWHTTLPRQLRFSSAILTRRVILR